MDAQPNKETVMAVVNWNPLRDFDDLFNQYNRLLSRRAGSGEDQGQAAAGDWRPVANISETPEAYLIKAELPEVAKKDIDVSVHDGVVTIRGERRFERKDDKEKYHRVESFYGNFARSFSLPADVDEAKIQAESHDGVLTVTLPKSEARKPRAIDVQVR